MLSLNLSRRITFFRSLLPQTRFLSTSRSSITPLLTSSISRTQLLRPQLASPLIATALSNQTQVRGMKTRSSVKRLCDGCKPVRRKNRVFIICSKNAKHKQRQGK